MTTNLKNILIIGDSYCANRKKETDWPVRLGKLANIEIQGACQNGNAWWSARRYLKSFLALPDTTTNDTLLIVVHTEPIRLPNDFNIPVNPGILWAANHKDPKNDLARHDEYTYLTGLNFYNSKLFSIEFYEWAQSAWIAELDASNEFYATLHIPAFDTVNLSNVKNGLVLRPSKEIRSLRSLSNLDIGDPKWFGPDSRSNHFNDENNALLADAIYEAINGIQPNASGEKYFHNLNSFNLKG